MGWYDPMDYVSNSMSDANKQLSKIARQIDDVSNQLGKIVSLPNIKRGCNSFSGEDFNRINKAFNDQQNEDMLDPFAEWEGQTVNIYWNNISSASTYIISVYKALKRRGKDSIVKLKDFTIDRNECYLSISNLIGTGYIFVVSAESRDGKIISRSRGIDGCGSPKTW